MLKPTTPAPTATPIFRIPLKICQLCGLWFWMVIAVFILLLLRHINLLLPSETHIFMHAPTTSTSRTTRERMALSEASWSSSVEVRHQKLAADIRPENPLFPAQNAEDFKRYPYTIWDFFPPTYTCPHDVQRVGRLGDGGKWVCGMSIYEARPTPKSIMPPQQSEDGEEEDIVRGDREGETVIYSFGVNDNSTFEAEMLARVPSARIYAFDHTVNHMGGIPLRYSHRAYFSKLGLGPKNQPNKNPPFYSLAGIMSQYNHTYIDILKIDVEGAEMASLDRFLDMYEGNEESIPVGQILMEVHLAEDVGYRRVIEWWERLEMVGLRATWMEANLLAIVLGRSREPRCMEYVLVNSKDPKSVIMGDGI